MCSVERLRKVILSNNHLISLLWVAIFVFSGCSSQQYTASNAEEEDFESKIAIMPDSSFQRDECTGFRLSPDSFDTDISVSDLSNEKANSLNYKYELGGLITFGENITEIGDITGDGITDILVNRSFHKTKGGGFDSGKKWCILDGHSLKKVKEGDDSNIHVSDGSGYGSDFAYIGNNDEEDGPYILVGAPRYTQEAGEEDSGEGEYIEGMGIVYVFDGEDMSFIRKLEPPSKEEDGSFGARFQRVGDANGDGVDDILISNHNEQSEGKRLAKVYLFSGSDLSLLKTYLWPDRDSAHPKRQMSSFGSHMANLDDVNGDGYTEFIIEIPPGEYTKEYGDVTHLPGYIYVYSGSDTKPIKVFKWKSGTMEKRDSYVEGVKDINGDGARDFFLPSERGPILYSGKTFKKITTINIEGEYFGEGKEFRRDKGTKLKVIDDINGDKNPDLIVGRPRVMHDDVIRDRGDDPGVVEIHSGEGITRDTSVTLAKSPHPSLLQRIKSPTPYGKGYFGNRIITISDRNGDNISDIIVITEEDRGHYKGCCRAYLFLSNKVN